MEKGFNPVEYLIKQLMDNNCTIVLGAGVSFSAKMRNINTIEDTDIHKTEKMIEKLKGELRYDESSENYSLGKLCQLYYWKNRKNDSLVDFLEIKKFRLLEPTAAHYYIAFLAREGFISDIITTNYDCCLEKAYFRTWGKDECPKSDEENCNSPCFYNEELKTFFKSKVARITGARSFAFQASRKRWNDNDENDRVNYLKPRVLRIYKINGCSCELYKKHSEDDKSDKILLTDTQLQDWRKRSWAADFFKNRLRTTSLVFSGFGSDEPQILHTIQKVFEEFDSEPTKKYENDDIILSELRNIPIIHSYEPEAKYVHQYITRHYLSICHNLDEVDFNCLIINKDKLFPGENQDNEYLDADTFWKEIYLRCLRNIAISFLERNNFYKIDSIIREIPCSDNILDEVRKIMSNEFNIDKNAKCLLDAFKIKCKNNSEQNNQSYIDFLPPIAEWIMKLRDKYHDNCTLPCYHPLSEHSVQFIELMFILRCLQGEFSIETYENGIKVQYKNIVKIFLSCNNTTCYERNYNVEGYEYEVIVELRLTSSPQINRPRNYRTLIGGNVVHVKVIQWHDIYRKLSEPFAEGENKIKKVKEIIYNIFLFPSKYQKDVQRSIPKRLENYKKINNGGTINDR